MNKAVISLWIPGFNGMEDGRKLEGIVKDEHLSEFLETIHYGEENLDISDCYLPITHVPSQDGYFRKV